MFLYPCVPFSTWLLVFVPCFGKTGEPSTPSSGYFTKNSILSKWFTWKKGKKSLMWQQFGKGDISLQMVGNQSCKHLYWSWSAITWGLHSSHNLLFGLTAFQWHHEQSSKNSTLDCHEAPTWALIQLPFALTTHHPSYPLSTLVSSLQSAVESCKTRHTFVKNNVATTSWIFTRCCTSQNHIWVSQLVHIKNLDISFIHTLFHFLISHLLLSTEFIQILYKQIIP
jgi:hypothetical protein